MLILACVPLRLRSSPRSRAMARRLPEVQGERHECCLDLLLLVVSFGIERHVRFHDTWKGHSAPV